MSTVSPAVVVPERLKMMPVPGIWEPLALIQAVMVTVLVLRLRAGTGHTRADAVKGAGGCRRRIHMVGGGGQPPGAAL
jgi:hypothetical protein